MKDRRIVQNVKQTKLRLQIKYVYIINYIVCDDLSTCLL